MSCYSTLSSHVQKGEFPDNGPSDFKARLPKDRLWQEDEGWEVGLSGASFPIIPPPEPGHPEKIMVRLVDIRKHGIRKDTCAPTTIAPQKRSITNYRSHAINGVSCCCRRLPLRRWVWSLSRSSIEWNRRSRTICELGSTFTLSTSISARPPKDEDRQNHSHVCMGGKRFDLGQYGGV